MTRHEQNEIILMHIDAELRDQPNISDRIGKAFSNWFQGLLQMAAPPPPAPEEGEESAA